MYVCVWRNVKASFCNHGNCNFIIYCDYYCNFIALIKVSLSSAIKSQKNKKKPLEMYHYIFLSFISVSCMVVLYSLHGCSTFNYLRIEIVLLKLKATF